MAEGILNYIEVVQKLKETADNYKSSYEQYDKKLNEESEIENEISRISDDIAHLEKGILLSKDEEKKELEELNDRYNTEFSDTMNIWIADKEAVENSEKQDKDIVSNIKKRYDDKISEKYKEVTNISNKIDKLNASIKDIKNNYNEVDEKIERLNLEENQIKICATHIAPDYENVVKNPGFIEDYNDPRGATASDAVNKFANLNAKKIDTIAKKLSGGIYVSSPDESEGIPVMEIFLMTMDKLGLVFKWLFLGLGFLYKQVKRFDKIWQKLVYCLSITFIIGLFIFVIYKRFGNGILFALLILLAVACLVFTGMIAFNVFKFSNVAFRKEQNLEYYTVGYYFLNHKDTILYKLASDYYYKLKQTAPDKLGDIINAVVDNLKVERKKISQAFDQQKAELEDAENKLVSTQREYSNVKEQLEIQCKQEVEEKLENLENERTIKLKELEKLYNDKNAYLTSSKNVEELNIKNNAIKIEERRKNEIEEKKQEKEQLRCKKNTIKEELEDIKRKSKEILKYNNDMSDSIYDSDKSNINTISRREVEVNDKFPDSLMIGIKSENADSRNIKVGANKQLYNISLLKHDNSPVIITFDCEHEEREDDKVVTKAYYSIIDAIIYDLLGRIYMKAFKCVISDSKGVEGDIINSMKLCGPAFSELSELKDNIEIYTDSIKTCFENIVNKREAEIKQFSKNGISNIYEINKQNKLTQNMIRTIILSIRLYSKKSGDFKMEDFKKNMNICKQYGIIPIVFMSSKYFKENRNNLERTIEELCKSTYYSLDMENIESKKEKEVELDERLI